MSLELSEESKEKGKKNNSNKEHMWKELLYELFYEIKSEILGTKIEIEEEEYQENIKTITIPKLVKYIHDSIQILIKKKIDESKKEQKEEDNLIFNNKDNNMKIELDNNEMLKYETILKKLECKERYLTKLNFQNKLQKDAMENKISDYMEMEDEFEEMKTKLKYEDGRFLNNDRKDNEIIIIRGENSNLKKMIKKLEQQITDLNKEISEKTKLISDLETEKKNLKEKLEEAKKHNDILNSHSININFNNMSGSNNKNSIQQNNNVNSINNVENINRHTTTKYPHYFNSELNTGKIKDEKMSKYFPYKKIHNKILNNKHNQRESLSNTKNESSEKLKSDFLNKYFTGKGINKNNNINVNGNTSNMPLNNSCVKVNYFPIAKNNKPNNNNIKPYFNRNMNYNLMKKVVSSGGNNCSRSTTNKIKGKVVNQNNINEINYQSLS
jgi:hypothetical protein